MRCVVRVLLLRHTKRCVCVCLCQSKWNAEVNVANVSRYPTKKKNIRNHSTTDLTRKIHSWYPARVKRELVCVVYGFGFHREQPQLRVCVNVWMCIENNPLWRLCVCVAPRLFDELINVLRERGKKGRFHASPTKSPRRRKIRQNGNLCALLSHSLALLPFSNIKHIAHAFTTTDEYIHVICEWCDAAIFLCMYANLVWTNDTHTYTHTHSEHADSLYSSSHTQTHTHLCTTCARAHSLDYVSSSSHQFVVFVGWEKTKRWHPIVMLVSETTLLPFSRRICLRWKCARCVCVCLMLATPLNSAQSSMCLNSMAMCCILVYAMRTV